MLINQLRQFTGTEGYKRHAFGSLVFTDGIKYLRDKDSNGVVDCFWLVDAIASHQSKELDRKCGGFQSWTLTPAPLPNKPKRALLECRPDSNQKPVVTQAIEYTDFPFDQMDGETLNLWVEGEGPTPKTEEELEERGWGRILLLPSEH